jgi:flagellin-specific chaperone FliS
LVSTLDMSQGQLASNLAGVYGYCMRLIVAT